jgi:polyisoprenyl-teichoic acid--peptidoglycan teichoic acid transferase
MARQTSRIERWRQQNQRRNYRRLRAQALSPPRLPLPGRRPRLAYLFAAGPALAVVAFLAAALFLYSIERRAGQVFDETPIALQVAAQDPGATPVQLPNWDQQERINLLLVGVDQREGEPYSRTDTIILVSIDPKAKTVGMLSFPRDMKVTIPGYGDYKINAAYIFGEMDQKPGGGIGLLERTIRANFGVQIHYYAAVDFRGFERIVDAFGGVTVDPPYPIVDDAYPTETYGYTQLYFPAGLQHLDGEQALRYARTRHADLDFGRAQRQQEVILALRQQALKGNLIQNFYKLVDVLGGSVRTDLSQTQVAQLANLGIGIPDGNIKQYSLQDLLTGVEGEDGEQYLAPTGNWSEIKARIRTIVPNAGAAVPSPTPDPGTKIAVRNGTLRDKFAARTVDRLQGRGFGGAAVDPTPVPEDTLPLAETIIYEYGKADMAILVAKALGLTEGSVRHATDQPPDGAEIVVVLGDDAPDPQPSSPATPRR